METTCVAMNQWYLPITFLPAIGLFVMSSVHLMTSLHGELDELEHRHNTAHRILLAKYEQLKRLTIVLVFLYIAAALFTVSGLTTVFNFLPESLANSIGEYILVAGVISLLLGLTFLVRFSFKGVKIRADQHRMELNTRKQQLE